VQRHHQAVERRNLADNLSLVMTIVEQAPGIFVPQRPGQAVNQIVGQVGRNQPLGANRKCLGCGHVEISPGLDAVFVEEGKALAQPLRLRPGDRQQGYQRILGQA
jgi:hypothetical protein